MAPQMGFVLSILCNLLRSLRSSRSPSFLLRRDFFGMRSNRGGQWGAVGSNTVKHPWRKFGGWHHVDHCVSFASRHPIFSLFVLWKNISKLTQMVSPLSSSALSLFSLSPRTINHHILSSLISMHKLCSLLPRSPCNSSFFPFFFLSLLSIRLRLSALLHPPSKYLWSLPLAVLGSLARALCLRRYADWLFFLLLLFPARLCLNRQGSG